MGEKPVIGFIGVGYMGHGMAKNILENGYTLWIKGNRNREPVENLLAKGAQEAGSAKEMASVCDIIHICLSNSLQVENVMRKDDGILAGAKAGLIVIDTTTADPGSTIALGAELKEKGDQYADAPLGRTPKEAEAGTLDAMVGCDDAVFETIRPVIECWAGAISHIGPLGSGHKMKLLMNFLSSSYASIYSEALSLASNSGIAPQKFVDVIGPSRLGCGFFDTFMQGAVGRDEYAHKFTIENMEKDLRYVNAMATDARVMNVMAASARHYYTHVVATGNGGDFLPKLADHVARLNGIDLEKAVKDT